MDKASGFAWLLFTSKVLFLATSCLLYADTPEISDAALLGPATLATDTVKVYMSSTSGLGKSKGESELVLPLLPPVEL